MKKIALLISTVCLMAACSTGPEEIPTVVEEPATDAVTRAASTIELTCHMDVQYVIHNDYHFAYWEVMEIVFIGSDGYEKRTINTGTPGYVWWGYGSSNMYSNKAFPWGINLYSVKISFKTDANVLKIKPYNFYIYVEDLDTGENSMVALDMAGKQNKIHEIEIPVVG
ncbi:MAG: hypothetical protein LUD76_02310, partial [Alistipes sp.]|nr:hypothetical protein [Alistipes sp.]